MTTSPAPAPKDTPNPGRRGIGRKLGISLAVLGLSLILIEAWATWQLGDSFERGRFVGNNWRAVGQKDPQLGWANRPGAVGQIYGGVEGFEGIFEYRAQINSLGFRDKERTWAKPSDRKRVVILGDSVAWGWGVDNGERFSDFLEARYPGRLECINLAVPGYGTDQQLWTLEANGWRFEPDLVVHCLIINDVFEAQSLESYAMAKPRFELGTDGNWAVVRPAALESAGGWRDRLKRTWRVAQANSAFLTWATQRELRWAGEDFFETLSFVPAGPDELRLVRDTAGRVAEPTSPTFHALERMQAACAERGIPLLVFAVAHGHDRYLYEPAYPQPEPLPGPDFASVLTQQVQLASEAIGFATLNVDGVMAARVQAGERLHCGDGHPNALGHQVIADELAPWVGKTLGLEP